MIFFNPHLTLQIDELAGNRTRASRVVGENSKTELVPEPYIKTGSLP